MKNHLWWSSEKGCWKSCAAHIHMHLRNAAAWLADSCAPHAVLSEPWKLTNVDVYCFNGFCCCKLLCGINRIRLAKDVKSAGDVESASLLSASGTRWAERLLYVMGKGLSDCLAPQLTVCLHDRLIDSRFYVVKFAFLYVYCVSNGFCWLLFYMLVKLKFRFLPALAI